MTDHRLEIRTVLPDLDLSRVLQRASIPELEAEIEARRFMQNVGRDEAFDAAITELRHRGANCFASAPDHEKYTTPEHAQLAREHGSVWYAAAAAVEDLKALRRGGGT